jgi:hypothetical protein
MTTAEWIDAEGLVSVNDAAATMTHHESWCARISGDVPDCDCGYHVRLAANGATLRSAYEAGKREMAIVNAELLQFARIDKGVIVNLAADFRKWRAVIEAASAYVAQTQSSSWASEVKEGRARTALIDAVNDMRQAAERRKGEG